MANAIPAEINAELGKESDSCILGLVQTEEQLSRHKSVNTHCLLLLSRLCALVRGEPQST